MQHFSRFSSSHILKSDCSAIFRKVMWWRVSLLIFVMSFIIMYSFWYISTYIFGTLQTFRFLACCDNLLRSSIFKPNSFWHTFYLFQFAHISSFLGNICTHFYLFWANFHTFYIFWANSHISSRVQFAHISFFWVKFATILILLCLTSIVRLSCIVQESIQCKQCITLCHSEAWKHKHMCHMINELAHRLKTPPEKQLPSILTFFQFNPSTVHLAKELASWRKALLGHLVLTAPSNHQWPTWVAAIKY